MKTHWPIVVAVGLPVLFIIAVIISIVVPQAVNSPRTAFVYVMKTIQYEVPAAVSTTPHTVGNPEETDAYFIYDPVKNVSSAIASSTLAGLSLDSNPVSPDGYEVGQQYYTNGVLSVFGGGDNYDNLYIYGHGIAKKLPFPQYTYVQDNATDFSFVGWVK
jgi:hypothetical protein